MSSMRRLGGRKRKRSDSDDENCLDANDIRPLKRIKRTDLWKVLKLTRIEGELSNDVEVLPNIFEAEDEAEEYQFI